MTRKPKPDWERADGVDGLEAPLIVPREQSGLPLDKFLAIHSHKSTAPICGA